MFPSKFVIYIVLIIYSADSAQLENGSNGTSVNKTSPEQGTESSDVILTDIPFNISTIIESNSSKPSSIGADHDIEITGHMSPSPLSDETESIHASTEHGWTTEFDSFNVTLEIGTTKNIDIKSVCSPNPCRNNGTCVEDAIVPFLFSCNCSSGYVGIRCGTVDKCVTDDEGQLCSNGACVFSKNGLTRFCQCFTGTYWDKTTNKCRDPDPPCFPNPCINDGVCSVVEGVAHCDCPSGYRGETCSILFKCGKCENGTCILNDEQTTKYCKCNDGLYWNEEHETCEVINSACDLSPCQNGGACVDVSDTEFNCSCPMGFSGNTCEITDKCSEDKDCGPGNCVLSSEKNVRSCQCNKGFYLEDKFHICKEITNVCQPNPCLNDGICTVVSANDYNCTCAVGYVGKKCDVRDLCETEGGNNYCGDGNCRNNYEQGVYFCTCDGNRYFQYASRKCIDLDLCPLMKCGSMETCIKGECLCAEHYKWDNETKTCKPDFCSSKPCLISEMTCEEGTGRTDYKCYCPEGFSFNGTHCIESSCIFPTLNPCNQFCSINEDGFECSCAEDFELKEDNNTCTYVGNSTCSNKTCDKGFCVKENETEVCICPKGYTEIDGICKDICTSGALMPGICPSDECEAIPNGGFRCRCEGKLALSKDKTTCMIRSICQEKEPGWKTCKEKNAKCIVDYLSSNGYKCECANGQIKTEGGICRDICSLENNQRQCSIRGATCDVDNTGRMVCKCSPYFQANERDGKCTRPAEFSYLITLPLDKSSYLVQKRQKRSLDPSVNYKKVSSDVTVTLREMITNFTQGNILSCKIMSEFILCRIELQFTSDSKSDLKRLEIEDICLGNGISNACLLPPSLILVKNKIRENVRIQPTDPCDKEIKNYVCGLETTCKSSLPQKSFNCSCKLGYFARRKIYPFGDTRSFVEICSDINECEEASPCLSNSNCENTIGSYTCSCKPGYRVMRGRTSGDSQKCVEICRPNPCTHGHCSRRGDHEFDCKCDAGYAGTLCDLQDEHFKHARINTIIVGVVLGGALLITFILFAACISRLRKKKMLDGTGQIIYNSTEMTERRRGEGGAVNNAFQRE